ncbi:metallophosphoesterase [bacterium]|nr:metallophosphoesterase [bacterium]
MSFRIAVIGDIHYKNISLDECAKRRSAIAHILLLRTVQRLNRYIKPDVTLILGDLIDDPDSPSALEELQTLKSITDRLDSRLIVIPGNHDPDADVFYSVFDRPSSITDIDDIRFVTFIDNEEPDSNASRSLADIKLMKSARNGHAGPIISLQHVPLFAPRSGPSPYSLTNAQEVWSAFDDNNCTLSISGHYHAGDNQVQNGTGKSIIVPALCESPFSFVEIEMDGDAVSTRQHQLSLPPELKLIDYHVHTPFAYCQENMDPELTVQLADEFGLGGFVFTEHSGQLYFDLPTFWNAEFMQDGLATDHGHQDRLSDYFELASHYCPPAYLGLELDCDYSGKPVVRPEDMQKIQVRLASIHWLEELKKSEPDMDKASDEMLRRLSVMFEHGIDILAHPFRIFHGTKNKVPERLVDPLVRLLREHNVAAEINFHNQITSEEFVIKCVESGVKLAFGSDSHNLYEVGEHYPHLQLMERCGYNNSDLPHILIQAPDISES